MNHPLDDNDVHESFQRLMADEPPHRPLPDLVRAGERGLVRRRLGTGAGALAVLGVVGLAASMLPHGSTAAHDGTGFADTSSTAPSAAPSAAPDPSTSGDPQMGQTLEPGKPAAYSYQEGPGCSGPMVGCDKYVFKVGGVRDSVVAAVEYRLIDGTSKRVPAHDGEYHLVMTGSIPAGYRFAHDKGLVDARGRYADMFAGLTLFASDGSVLATGTSKSSDQLDAYPEYCDLLARDEPCVRP